MGSSQSVPAAGAQEGTATSGATASINNMKSLPQQAAGTKDPQQAASNVNKDSSKKKKRTGFDLVQYKCRRRKAAYDKCYGDWYSKKFLTAEDINRDESCDDLFEKWRECILRGMLKERERQGLPPPKEGSILGEFIEEQSDE